MECFRQMLLGCVRVSSQAYLHLGYVVPAASHIRQWPLHLNSCLSRVGARRTCVLGLIVNCHVGWRAAARAVWLNLTVCYGVTVGYTLIPMYAYIHTYIPVFVGPSSCSLLAAVKLSVAGRTQGRRQLHNQSGGAHC